MDLSLFTYNMASVPLMTIIFMQLIISLYIGDHFLVGQVTINFKVALIMYYVLGFLLMHFHTAFAWLIKWSTDTQTQCLVVC